MSRINTRLDALEATAGVSLPALVFTRFGDATDYTSTVNNEIVLGHMSGSEATTATMPHYTPEQVNAFERLGHPVTLLHVDYIEGLRL